jgi:SAM-dependent methyltransferase
MLPSGSPRTGSPMFSNSDAYDRYMGRWSRRLTPLFVQFAHIQEGQTVLDLGCGTGQLSAGIAESVPVSSVTGVDRSPEYVGAARRRVQSHRAQFEIGDAQELRFADGTFDRVLSLLVLNFVPDRRRALREMIRVTRPGGIVAAAVWDYGDGMEMLRTFWDEAVALDPEAAAKDERHSPLCRCGELAALWLEFGLNDVDEQSITVALDFASFDDYWEPFLSGQAPGGAYASSLPRAWAAQLRERLRARLLRGALDRPFVLHARAWAVRGAVPNLLASG